MLDSLLRGNHEEVIRLPLAGRRKISYKSFISNEHASAIPIFLYPENFQPSRNNLYGFSMLLR